MGLRRYAGRVFYPKTIEIDLFRVGLAQIIYVTTVVIVWCWLMTTSLMSCNWCHVHVQLTQFSICVIAARICCGAVVITCAHNLAVVAEAVDSCFRGHPSLLLFFVMVGFPVFMNTGEAIIQDQFLKWRRNGTSTTGVNELSLSLYQCRL